MNAPANIMLDKTKHDWWRAALKGNRGPIHDGEPMTGFYRSRTKNKKTGEVTLHAIAFWYDKNTGECHCQKNEARLEGEFLQRAVEQWPYTSKEPISYETWTAVVKEGKPWPDQHVVKPAEPVAVVTPQGSLSMEIEQAKAGLERYKKIESDAESGAAQSLRSILLALSSKAKKAREEANRPHNDAIRANGAIWSPLEAEAKAAADLLRDGPIKAWEVHKREQAAAAAKAAQAAQASGEHVTAKSNAPAPSARIKGATGRAASVGTTEVAEIIDQDAVYQHFRDNEQLKAILQALANAAVRAGIDVPGTTVKEDVSIK